MSKFIQTSEARFQATEMLLRNQEALIHNLKNQIGKLTSLMSGRQQGSLSGNTKLNPREHAKVISLGGSKELRRGKFDNLAREDYNL